MGWMCLTPVPGCADLSGIEPSAASLSTRLRSLWLFGLFALFGNHLSVGTANSGVHEIS
jgi:hypothetical protein